MEDVQRFLVEIDGTAWDDVQDLELSEAPHAGDTIETKYGTCVVQSIEAVPDSGEHAGKIVCHLP
jgi:hypothetical protein